MMTMDEAIDDQPHFLLECLQFFFFSYSSIILSNKAEVSLMSTAREAKRTNLGHSLL